MPERRWGGCWEFFRRGTLSHADTREISGHSPTRKPWKAKDIQTIEASTNVYIQNHWSTALKLLGKIPQTQTVLSPETPWTLYNYISLEEHIAYGAKYWWHKEARNKNQKTSKTWNTVRYSESNKQKPSTIPSRECNHCIWASVVLLVAKISERHRKC